MSLRVKSVFFGNSPANCYSDIEEERERKRERERESKVMYLPLWNNFRNDIYIELDVYRDTKT